MKDRADHQ